jgi:transposase-like protein
VAPSRTDADRAAFIPPFCPNPRCPWHTAADTRGWRVQRRGARAVQRAPRPTRRFRCLHCGRWFSDATFSLDYWKKKPGLAPRLYPLIVDGKALRQAARTLGVGPSTVKRHERQLARQALLHLERALRRLLRRLAEPVEIDGLRTFAGSQYEPAEVNTLVAADSGFLLACDPFPLRRSGSMTPRQQRERRRREARRGRPDPRARRRSVAQLLQLALDLTPPDQPLRLRSDEEPDYVRVRRALGRPVVHVRVSGRLRRQTAHHPLWLTNHKHRLLRHLLASLRRETIAHHKTLQGLAERLALVHLWLNLTKGVSERRSARARTTPAMLLGLAAKPLPGAALFAERLFPERVGLSPWLRPRYEGRLVRPGEQPAPAVPRFAA